jgi:DNA-binding NarL/FixJ family response regulator
MTKASARLPVISVMLIEDDDGLRPEIVEYLRRRRHHVMACASLTEARQALETALTNGTPPGAVICDIGLPDGNGLDFYIAFAHRLPASHWILMSGSHDTHRLKQELEKLAGLRPPQVVEKPLPLKVLGLLVQELSTQ